MKQKLKGGDEVDWVSRFHSLISWGRGEGKRIKRKMNKRSRKEGKLGAKNE